jgi:hypothetical protein
MDTAFGAGLAASPISVSGASLKLMGTGFTLTRTETDTKENGVWLSNKVKAPKC